jgi:hypothetical protein
VNHQETLAALTIHGRRNRNDAANERSLAATAKADAAVYASQHLGEAMAAKRADIIAEGERTAAEHLGQARRHDERAAMAEAGFLLHGDIEMRDPSYAMGNQPLISAASKHGLMRGQPDRPNGVMGNAPSGKVAGLASKS